MNYEELYTLSGQVEERLQPVFRGFERTAEKNTKRVLDAFRAATTIWDARRWKRSLPRYSARKRRSCAPRL